MSITSFSGKIYPDRTFSLGMRAKKEQKRLEDSAYDRNYEQQYDTYTEASSEYGRTRYDQVRFFRGKAEEAIGLSRVINHHKKKRRKYGTKGITKYGQKTVRCISHLLQDKFRKKRLGFGTATIPELSEEHYRIVANNWGDVVRRFFQSITREYKRLGEQLYYVGCTEIQEQRYESSGLPYLHLHWVYNSRKRKSGSFFVSANRYRSLWQDTITNVIKLHTNNWRENAYNFNASIDVAVVRRSAKAYLGKYLTKGLKSVGEVAKAFPDLIPAQWWFACMQCKKMFKDSIIRMDAKLAESFFYQLEHYLHEGTIVWARFVEVLMGGELKRCGLVGTISQDAYDLLVG